MNDRVETAHGVALGRRRPSGEAPPLPRQFSPSSRVYAGLLVAVVALWVVLLTDPGTRVVTAVDDALLDGLARLRTPALDSVMRGLHALGSDWTVRLIGWPTLLTLLALRRFHRLVLLLAISLVVVSVDAGVAQALTRMRPTGPEILGGWSGYAHPSMPVALLGLTVVGALYTLVPAGTWRNRIAWPALGAVALLALARLYLAVDHPTDVLAAAVTGMAGPVVAFRLLAPDDVVPVTYRRGRRAHLDIGGRRGEAIAAALRAQLGLELVHIEPFALSGSSGSTPVKLVVRDSTGERLLFGKLYASVHLRSDRWYKLARTVMYGRLEDERSFNSVRRLVEYEDHMLRFAGDAGLPTPRPDGFIEITPEREYLLVTEFLDGSKPLRDGPLSDEVVDAALALVRRMWAVGFAHRDVKPSNVLVRGDDVLLIDLAFAAMRPSPWRQAVDLANMMMTLSLADDPDRVYQRALAHFTPDELAEAFAASRGATVPTQLRSMLKQDHRDVAARLRALAPTRTPVAIQRWGVRRVVLTVALLAVLALTSGLFYDYLAQVGLR